MEGSSSGIPLLIELALLLELSLWYKLSQLKHLEKNHQSSINIRWIAILKNLVSHTVIDKFPLIVKLKKIKAIPVLLAWALGPSESTKLELIL